MRTSVTLLLVMAGACAGPSREAFDEGHLEPALVEGRQPSPECTHLRALTFNAFSITFHDHHDELARLGAREVAAEGADIVALQELWYTHDAELYADALRDAGLVHQVQQTSEEVLARGSSGLLIASRYPIVEHRFVPFRSGAAPYWMWPPDWYASKGALDIVVETEAGPLRVVNAHIHADYEAGGYLRERVGQSAELAALIRQSPDLPVLAAGDMNSQPHEPSHTVLVRGSGARVLARANVDLILSRSGTERALFASDAQRALVHRVPMADGTLTRLSDHAAVSVSLSICPAAGEAQAPLSIAELPDVSEVVRDGIALAKKRIVAARSLTLLCLLYVLAATTALFRKRRRLALSSYAWTPILLATWMALWTIYQGWIAAPLRLEALEALL